MVGNCLWPPPEGIEECYQISGRVTRFPVRDIYIYIYTHTHTHTHTTGMLSHSIGLSTEYKIGICSRWVGGKNCTHAMSNEFSLSCALFSPVLLTGLNKYSGFIMWVQPSAEAARFTFLLFLSFRSQVFGLVSEFECWSLFMIAPFVWKELVFLFGRN